MKLFIFSKMLLIQFLILPAVVLAAIDLQIASANLTFSNATPLERENVLINATLSNAGNQTASNVLVKFLDDSEQIGNLTVVVPAFSSISIAQVWKAEIGPNKIKVVLDPSNSVPETDETNNEAVKNISISGYHTYFGKAEGVTALGFFFDTLFERAEPACNVLVADTDSNVDFSSLQALGIKKNGEDAKQDFKDLDVVMNMTKFDDSISILYSKNAQGEKAKETANLFVFGNTINKVPIINSTNNTIFRTGILWDKSDDGQGCSNEEDDDEDDDNDEESNDDNEEDDFCAFTQGGWGTSCTGNNSGCVRDNNFDFVFPIGMVIGNQNTITLTSSAAVSDFLPAGGTPNVLTQNHNNPISTEAGAFGGQVTALQLNVEFSDAGVNQQGLGDQTAKNAGLFAGLTVRQLLALAEQVLGGNTSALTPFSASISDLNDAVTEQNEGFTACEDDDDDDKNKKKEYDTCDQEDIVIISKVKPLQIGKFGKYDYEIKVPALIRDYKPGSSTVAFYLDLSSPCP